METTFASEIREWSDFYSAIAGAAATLLGLLFVALALNPAVMRDGSANGMRAWAAETFHNFLVVLAIALTMLVPDQQPFGTGLPMLILGVHGVYRVTRDVSEARRDADPRWQSMRSLTRFAAPGLAYALLTIGGIWTISGDPDGPDMLISVIFLLIISASASCWDLLREIGDDNSSA